MRMKRSLPPDQPGQMPSLHLGEDAISPISYVDQRFIRRTPLLALTESTPVT